MSAVQISELMARSLTVAELAERLRDHPDYAVRNFVERSLQECQDIEDLSEELRRSINEIDEARSAQESAEDLAADMRSALEECEKLACVRLDKSLHALIKELING